MAGPDPHHEFMHVALEQARKAAARGEVPVGAVVVKDGKVLSVAGNDREASNDPTGHAELVAIQRAARILGHWRLEGCTVYVTLEPCAMCSGAMVLARIERCVYGTRDPKGGFMGSLGDLSSRTDLNHRFEVVEGIEADACSQILKDFFKALRARRADEKKGST